MSSTRRTDRIGEWRRSLALLLTLLLGFAATAFADDHFAGKEWQAGFHRTGTTIPWGPSAAATADLGAGEQVYFLGLLQAVGPEPRQILGDPIGIHWWDGTTLHSREVAGLEWARAFRALVDATGPALFAAGRFTTEDGESFEGIARWDGFDVIRLPTLRDNVDQVLDVATFVVAGVPQVVCAGELDGGRGFVSRLGADGWERIGEATTAVRSLAVLGAGAESRLVASTAISGQVGRGLGAWDGASWSALTGSQGAPAGSVVELVANGPGLVASISPPTGGSSGREVALFANGVWRSIGTLGPEGGWIRALAVFDSDDGPRIAVSGVTSIDSVSATGLVTWTDAAGWEAVPGAIEETTYCTASSTRSLAPGLYCDGGFQPPAQPTVFGFARWTGSEWFAIPEDPLPGLGLRSVSHVARLDDGSGSAIYATAGFATSAEGERATVIRLLESVDGPSGWESVGGRFLDRGGVTRLAVYDDGDGPRLYAGGFFETLIDGSFAGGLARFDGESWGPILSASGVGLGPQFVELQEMLVHDDGSGSKLYVAGCIESVGSVAVTGIARWDGVVWEALPPLASLSGPEVCVNDLLIDPSDGSLLAVGAFDTAGGVDARHVARWDGALWSAVAADNTQTGSRAGVYWAAIGSGPDQPLCVSGFLQWLAPSFEVDTRLACLDERGQWHAVPAFDDEIDEPLLAPLVLDLEWSPDGRLIAFGHGRTIEGETVNRLAAWRAGSWRAFEGPLGIGVPDAVFSADFLLDPRPDGATELWLALGLSTSAGGLASSGVVLWAPCEGPCTAQIFSDGFDTGGVDRWSLAVGGAGGTER